MAFVRRRGRAYYLVHNFRERGRVRQVQLASLGRRPRISDDVIEGVVSKHPLVRVDWKRLRETVSRELVQPLKTDSQYLRDLLSSIRDVHLEIADLQLPSPSMTPDRELRLQLTSELKLLRGTLDVKLAQFRRGRVLPLRT
jgi:hypothetical protein